MFDGHGIPYIGGNKKRVKEIGYWVINPNHYSVTIRAQGWAGCGGGNYGNSKEGDSAFAS
ncbi:hypothetical protein GCM10027580_23700 [Corynebacterium faecale]